MRAITLAKRNIKEILRDKINIAFLLGFPLILLFLLSAIQSNIPIALFEIQHLTPGITVFGLSFVTLFSATLISKDRSSSFLHRLYTTPIRPIDFITGYTLPLMPIALGQTFVCYAAAVALGLEITINMLYAILLIIPSVLLYIALGLLFGSILNDKQVSGVCGGLLTNLSAWLSGIWFDLELAGEGFKKIANLLPFVHSVEMERAILLGNFSHAISHLWWILGYTAVLFLAAVLLFLKQMKN